MMRRRVSRTWQIVLSVALCVCVDQARAADLGGACCADLEERIAELEATTASKGSRRVRLAISWS